MGEKHYIKRGVGGLFHIKLCVISTFSNLQESTLFMMVTSLNNKLTEVIYESLQNLMIFQKG